ERGLTDGDHAGAGHVEIVVGCATDAMDVRIDEFHLGFRAGGGVISLKIISTCSARVAAGLSSSSTRSARRSFSSRASEASTCIPSLPRATRSRSAARLNVRQRISGKYWSIVS